MPPVCTTWAGPFDSRSHGEEIADDRVRRILPVHRNLVCEGARSQKKRSMSTYHDLTSRG